MTTVFVFTHVLMLISIVAITWVAVDIANLNFDLGIKRVPPNFWKNKTKLHLIKFRDFSFDTILLIKNTVNKISEPSKKKLTGALAFLVLILITLIIRDVHNSINQSSLSSGVTISYHHERIHSAIKKNISVQ